MKNKFVTTILALMALLVASTSIAQVSFTQGGMTGQWYNPQRDGEGIWVEIIDSIGGKQVAGVSFYTYDSNGFQMWLVGGVVIEGDPTSVTIPVQVTAGPKFGPDYNPEEVTKTDWGTLTLSFSDCSTGLLSYQSTVGFGSGGMTLTRLTNVTQVRCEDPPPPSGGGQLAAGRWSGPGVCFFLSEDGRTLISEGSTCEGGNAFVADLDGINSTNGACRAMVQCKGVIAIVDGGFSCNGDKEGEIGSGSFWNPTNAAGTAVETAESDYCLASNWKATPENPNP